MSEDGATPEERDDDERCKPHDNRLPCPKCLADKYQVRVWNSI